MRRLLILLAVAALAILGGRLTLGEAETDRGRVLRVIDGDTVEVRVGARRETVRLIGIDTPERGDCGYRAASEALRTRAQDRRVVLVSDPTQDARDRYDRMLAYVELRSGRDLGELLVREGWTETYVYDRPFERLARYEKAERRARARRRGVHGSC